MVPADLSSPAANHSRFPAVAPEARVALTDVDDAADVPDAAWTLVMLTGQAAAGLAETTQPDTFRVSPLATARELVKAKLPRNVPAELADQYEACDRVWDPPAHEASVAVPVCVALPADATGKAIAGRVVSPAALLVPADPGSPVWNFRNPPPAAPVTESTRALAMVADTPTVTKSLPGNRWYRNGSDRGQEGPRKLTAAAAVSESGAGCRVHP